MPNFQIENAAVINTYNNLVILCSWLRPGWLAYVVGTHMHAMQPTAQRLMTEHQALLADAAKVEPPTLPDGAPNPKAGQPVMETLPDGRIVGKFETIDKAREFREREAALMGAMATFTVDERLTVDHFKRIDEERLPTPKGDDVRTVDFSVLMALVDRTDESIVVPPSPRRNGVARARR